MGLYYDDVVDPTLGSQLYYKIIQWGLKDLKNKFSKTTNSEAIFSHGNSDSMNKKNASEWVNIIKNKSYYNEYVKNGKAFDIYLYACHTGHGDNSIASLIAKELPSNFVIHAPTGYLVNWGPYHFDTPFIGSDPFFGAFFPKGKWLQFNGGKYNE